MVKGCKDVYASFDRYCEDEMMEGANQYHAEGHGLQARLPWLSLGLCLHSC